MLLIPNRTQFNGTITITHNKKYSFFFLVCCGGCFLLLFCLFFIYFFIIIFVLFFFVFPNLTILGWEKDGFLLRIEQIVSQLGIPKFII